MADGESRGSDKLWQEMFEAGPPKGEHLAELLSAAQSEYTVKRWWKYGQPAIDVIKGVIDIPVASAGDVLTSLLKLHSPALQVGFEVFPYGVVQLEGVRVDLQLQRNLQR